LSQEGKVKEKGPSSAHHRKMSRGRSHVEAQDKTSKKALQEGVKLLTETKSVVCPLLTLFDSVSNLTKRRQRSYRRLKLSAKDAKIKAESEKTEADPSKLDKWMKQQASLSRFS
jgi:hypothetical protein